jgi:bifunctional DNA-binding transcriptional regulator/antitoxin component of YhaV-PrlF toxin-antitoxin module
MTRVTGKFQITLPRRLVDTYGIRVGDEVDLVPAGESIAIVPARAAKAVLSTQARLRHFDEATQRQRARRQARSRTSVKGRGWTREELYSRGRPR